MNILVCPDKFKGSLTASQVCDAIQAGLQRYLPSIAVTSHPLADGGDGMLAILQENIGLTMISMQVHDPLLRPVQASYGLSAAGDTAYIEMSKASGLVLLKEHERNCLVTNTYGTGELILDAIKKGVKRIVLGMGGSATNDAATGVAAALGYRFYDAKGNELQPLGKNLIAIARIDDSGVVPELAAVQIDLASDVQNLFYGKSGAAWTFGRQKGADDAGINLLDDGLKNMARLFQDKWGRDVQSIPGAGAAGGLGGGAIAFLNANLGSGIDMIAEVTGLADKIAHTDLVITGEGKLDDQTLGGKVIDGVVGLAKQHNKKVAVLCGASTLSAQQLNDYGIDYCGQIMTDGRSLSDAMTNGYQYLEQCAYDCIKALQQDTNQ